jgi:hypothetical protein
VEHSELSSKNIEAARQGHPGRPRVAFVQPIIPKYRSNFLRRFLEFTKLDILALCGNIRSGKAQKVRNYDGIGGFRHKALWAPFLLVRVQGNVCPIYFNPWNPQDIAEKILLLKNNPDIRSTLVETGKSIVTTFFKSWDEIATNVTEEVKRLI